jgi:NADH-quinone oxidoreductase subunit M
VTVASALNGGDWGTTTLWLLPAVAAIVIGVIPWNRVWSAILAMGVLIVELGLTVYAAERFHPSAGVQFVHTHAWVSDLGIDYAVGIDGLSLVLVVVTAFLFPCAVAFGLWAGRESLRAYLGFMLFLEAALMLLFVAHDLVLFYVGFEAMLVPLAFLISGWGGPDRVAATVRFVIYTLVGSLLMLVAIITLGIEQGTFDVDRMHASGSTLAFLAFMAAFAIKSPLYPFHGWVPGAYGQSSPEVAALLSGIVSKAGAYGMLRFALPLFPGPAADWRVVLIVLSLVGLLWCSLVAFRMPDSRGVIAYSSIAQMGLIALGIFVLNDQGATGAAFQMVNHGLLSVTLFLIAGFVELRFHTGLFSRVGALARGRPALATICITAGVAALAVPGSNLFASEFLVLLGSFRRSWVIGVLAALAIVLAAMYMLRWISAVLHDRPSDPVVLTDAEAAVAARDVRWEAVFLVPLLVAVLALSVYPYWVTGRVSTSVHALIAAAAQAAG